jgi:hypothetical protein
MISLLKQNPEGMFFARQTARLSWKEGGGRTASSGLEGLG